MRKNNLLNKTLLLSLAAVMSMSILAGCQSKKAQASTGNQGTTNEQRQNRQFNAEDMKKRMEDNINSLVADGTINQSQADKIVEALTANPQGFGGGQRNRQNGNQNNGQNSGQNGQQNNQQNNGQNGQQNNQKNNNQNGQRNNALSKLVSDGVITQAQADAVMQKIRGSFNRNPNNPGNSNNQNNQNNSNNKTS